MGLKKKKKTMLPHSKTQPNTFVDGVPVKISEQYKPPRRVILPVSCQNCTPGEALYQDYDFKLEHNVINKLAEWKKARQEEVEKRKERLKAQEKVCEEINQFSNLTLNQPQSEGVEQATQILNTKLTDTILTPVSVKQASPSNKPTSSLFNLSDFESDNSSPFDNMELKTINDMEVLASILTTDNTKRSLNNNNNIIDKELGKNGLALNNKHNEWGHLPLNSYNNFAYSNLRYNDAINAPKNIDFNNQYGLYPVSENFQIYNNYGLNDFSNQFGVAVSLEQAASGTSKHENQTLGTNLESKSQQVNFMYSQKPKSVPDIVKELEKELKENKERESRRCGSPPLKPSNSRKIVKIQRESPTSSKSGSPNKRNISKLPDPTPSLSPTIQQLARHISEMGFPLPRVARACKSFDGDDKKVIEFLLTVQNLEDKNYPGDLVEKALHVNHLDVQKCVKYLDAMIVLLDLGFEEEMVEKALLATDIDRDKALDILIS